MEALVASNSDDTIIVPDADGTIVAQGGDDIICDSSDGGNHIVAGTGDDTVVYEYSADRDWSEYLGGSGVDRLVVQISQSDYDAIKADLDAELAAYADFLDGVVKTSGEATGQWFEFQSLSLQAKQFETIELIVIPDETTDLGTQSSTDEEIGLNGQTISATLTSQESSFDGTADADITINFGEPVQPEINVVFTFDNSGSTAGSVAGASVGDLNGDGLSNTVLDVEIAALNALAADIASKGFDDGAVSITLIPFDSIANNIGTVVLDGSDGTTITEDLAQIASLLANVQTEFQTNYVDALTKTDTALDALDPSGTETNLVYFLSDGNPVPLSTQTPAAVQAAADQIDGSISAFGIGNSVDATYLDIVDNTGSSQIVLDPNDLAGTLLADPVSAGLIVDADVFVFDGDGNQTSALDLDPSDFTSDALGLTLTTSVEDILGLDPDLNDSSTLTLVVQVDSDGDGVADTTLETDLIIEGLMPETIC